MRLKWLGYWTVGVIYEAYVRGLTRGVGGLPRSSCVTLGLFYVFVDLNESKYRIFSNRTRGLYENFQGCGAGSIRGRVLWMKSVIQTVWYIFSHFNVSKISLQNIFIQHIGP